MAGGVGLLLLLRDGYAVGVAASGWSPTSSQKAILAASAHPEENLVGQEMGCGGHLHPGFSIVYISTALAGSLRFLHPLSETLVG